MFGNNFHNYSNPYPYFYPNVQYFYPKPYWAPSNHQVPYYQPFSISPPQTFQTLFNYPPQQQSLEVLDREQRDILFNSIQRPHLMDSKDEERSPMHNDREPQVPIQQRRSPKSRIINPNRNLESNSLKLFLKQMKQSGQRKDSLVKKIIDFYELQINPKEFVQILNQNFPNSLTYIKPRHLKKICQIFDGPEKEFSLTLRICLCHFFKLDVYLMNTRSVRTTREIRSKQIKAGQNLLRYVLEL